MLVVILQRVALLVKVSASGLFSHFVTFFQECLYLCSSLAFFGHTQYAWVNSQRPKQTYILPNISFFYQNGVEELDKLARFLEVDLTDKLRDEIVEMCSIDKMQKEKPSFEELFKNIGVNNGYSFFRKGIMSLFCWYKLQKDKKISLTSHYQFLVHVKKTKTF